MGRLPGNDIDLATTAEPEKIMALFPRVIPTGIKHGTVTIMQGKFSVEVTTLRIERGFSDGRRPDHVQFVDDIVEDLSRRDFTMNAMAYEMAGSVFHDPFGGREDICAHIIRSVGDPEKRFAEDGLRPLRAIRFAAQLGFDIEPKTFESIHTAIPTFRLVSPERIRDEFQKILLSASPARGLRLLESTSLLAEILPEFIPCRGCTQKGMHRYDVLDHLFLAVDASPAHLPVRLAALFHDVGKPGSKALGEDGIPTFHGHEKLSAKIAEQALKRLRFPNEIIDATIHLILHHMFNYTPAWSDAAVRRFISRTGVDAIDNLLALRRADTAATFGISPEPRGTEDFETRLAEILRQASVLGIKDMKINGNDLASIGVPKGPVMGRLLHELFETVLDDPAQNKREVLLKIAKALMPKLGL